MPHDRLEKLLAAEGRELAGAGVAKGAETVTVGVVPAEGGLGPRYLLEGEGARRFLRMNSNGYLGLARHPGVIAAAGRDSRP